MKKLLLIGIAVLVVAGGATMFVLDNTLFAPVAVSTAVLVAPALAAPTQQTATDEEATASEPIEAATSDAILYQIDPAQSEVRYEVSETFFQDNRFALAVGTTQGIAGELLVDFAQPSDTQIGDIVIDVSQFTSDESRRDNFIRNTGLESAQYPLATFSPQSIEGLPAQIAEGDSVSFTMAGDLTVKETTRSVTWDVTLTLNGDQIVGSASTEISMSDFGVGPIQLAFLATEDQVNLFFDFVAVSAEA
ncbi:MAG: YceI family protein [Anaerolineae bacterium]